MDAEATRVARRIIGRLGMASRGGGGAEERMVREALRAKVGMLGWRRAEAVVEQQMRGTLVLMASSNKTAAPPPPHSGEVEKGRGEDDENVVGEEIEAEVFQQYRCESEGVPAARPHPGDIAESGLLASVPLPRLTYCTRALATRTDVLSDLQLEGVLHACQRHAALSNGVRFGFFLGDGAGVGKGRQIAAIILDSVARGRQKHLWFSIASDLRLDAERDLRDVGCHVGVVDGCGGLDASAKLAFGSTNAKRGVLFSTYSTLISATKEKKRIDQLVTWCGGPGFEGCLVFDEAHKAKNFDAKKEQASTKMAQAVIAIQDRLPRARVVYASATGVSEISNMAYASRLGLWGPGTSFDTFKLFSEVMDKRGVGALEMLALELKASGAYVSRGLSWGQCEFEHVVCRLPKSAISVYDRAATWWRALRRAFDIALGMVERAGSKSKNRGITWQRFWGAQLRFFKEVQTAMKVPFVVDEAEAALAADCVVVIGLQATGEAGLDHAMVRHHPGDVVPAAVSAAKVSASRFVREYFPVQEVLEKEEEEPLPSSSSYSDDAVAAILEVDGRPAPPADRVKRHKEFLEQAAASSSSREPPPPPLPELVALRDAALRALEAVDVPASPLDVLIDALGGTGKVAEMTGRSSRIARRDPSAGPLRYEVRDQQGSGSSSDSLNIRERKAFMDGKKSVAIISDAASTGVSLHAAVGTPAAHKRRVHVTLELAWSADKSIQQLGRSHRANQVTAPVYKLVTTDLAGENRFAAAVARRLSNLGALTKGDRRAASGQDLSDFDVDNKHGRQALGKMAQACTNRFDNKIAYDLSLEKLPRLAEAVRKARDAVSSSSSSSSSSVPSSSSSSLFATLLERAGGMLRREALSGEPPTSFGALDDDDDSMALCVLARRAYAELEIDPKKQNEVRTFLNRLQALDVVAQNLLFEYFASCYAAVVGDAKANGTLDAGVADIRATSAKIDRSEVVQVDEVSGAETRLSEITLDRGVDWDAVEQRAAETSSSSPWETGFYRSRRPLPSTKKHGVLLAVRKAGTTNFVITRPNTGTSPYEMLLQDLRDKYAPAGDLESVAADWTRQYEDADTVDRGARKIRIGIVSGAVVPFWRALETTVANNRLSMTRAEQALKVCRVALDDGTRLVGIRFPIDVLPALRGYLRTEKHARASKNVRVDDPTPVDDAAFAAASTPPKTITSFFKPVNGNKRAVVSSLTSNKPPQKKKPKKAADSSIRTFFAPPPSFSECPCCGDMIETNKINAHLDAGCGAAAPPEYNNV
ncbi:hypothetical protein CTAYLR_004535 [Chrysophaeum taylorii]|uniref:Uncharacterized protein n=1 Tax=Chrysophaeum taylorii TaxID=2483200 RepID=A0AAD7XN22_9STRA|nr:hypothetical protein CTAYLR_004535 [Chrysophaeum taylorii]